MYCSTPSQNQLIDSQMSTLVPAGLQHNVTSFQRSQETDGKIHLFYPQLLDGESSPLLVNIQDDELDIVNQKNFRSRERVLVGISLSNSYFSEDRLQLILSGLSSYFHHVSVVITDKISAHNFRALGCAENRIKKKVQQGGNRLINKMERGIATIQNPEHRQRIRIYRWDEIEEFAGYHRSLDYIKRCYHTNSLLAKDVHLMTEKVMGKYDLKDVDIDEAIDEAKWYLLKEMAFIISATDFFQSPLLAAYYTDFPVYRKLLLGYYTDNRVEDHGFITYKCTGDISLSPANTLRD